MFSALGVNVQWTKPTRLRGLSPMADFRYLLRETPQPVIFDVGANDGTTTQEILETLPTARVYAFEPFGPNVDRLRELYGTDSRVRLEQAGVGEEPGELTLNTFEGSRMNSFLNLSEDPTNLMRGRYEKQGTATVKIVTIDGYCREQGLKTVDLLKIDTQGFDLKVLRGASAMLAAGQVRAVLLEVNFRPMYEGQPSLVDIMQFLDPYGFRMVDCYNHVWRDGYIAWCDISFVKHGSFNDPAGQHQ